jgi:hypothetical protein
MIGGCGGMLFGTAIWASVCDDFRNGMNMNWSRGVATLRFRSPTTVSVTNDGECAVKKGRHRRYEEARALKRGPDLDIEDLFTDLREHAPIGDPAPNGLDASNDLDDEDELEDEYAKHAEGD